MSRRIPLVSKGKKICIICEGDEEVDYLSKLISLKVWNKSLNIILLNAMGNGNITARYQDAFQNSEYDMVFAFVDTDYYLMKNIKILKEKLMIYMVLRVHQTMWLFLVILVQCKSLYYILRI